MILLEFVLMKGLGIYWSLSFNIGPVKKCFDPIRDNTELELNGSAGSLKRVNVHIA
jgi:hypothetical protein